MRSSRVWTPRWRARLRELLADAALTYAAIAGRLRAEGCRCSASDAALSETVARFGLQQPHRAKRYQTPVKWTPERLEALGRWLRDEGLSYRAMARRFAADGFHVSGAACARAAWRRFPGQHAALAHERDAARAAVDAAPIASAAEVDDPVTDEVRTQLECEAHGADLRREGARARDIVIARQSAGALRATLAHCRLSPLRHAIRRELRDRAPRKFMPASAAPPRGTNLSDIVKAGGAC